MDEDNQLVLEEDGRYRAGWAVLLTGDYVFGWQPALGTAGLWVSALVEHVAGCYAVRWTDGPLEGEWTALDRLQRVTMAAPARRPLAALDGADSGVSE